MKNKGIGILSILVLVLLLSACGEGGVKEKRFKSEVDGMTISLTYEYQMDKVKKQTTKTIVSYDAIGADTKEEAEELYDLIVEDIPLIEGLEQTLEFGDSELTEITKADYDVLDLDLAKDIPGMNLSGDLSNGISMEKTEDMLLEQGFEEVE